MSFNIHDRNRPSWSMATWCSCVSNTSHDMSTRPTTNNTSHSWSSRCLNDLILLNIRVDTFYDRSRHFLDQNLSKNLGRYNTQRHNDMLSLDLKKVIFVYN